MRVPSVRLYSDLNLELIRLESKYLKFLSFPNWAGAEFTSCVRKNVPAGRIASYWKVARAIPGCFALVRGLLR